MIGVGHASMVVICCLFVLVLILGSWSRWCSVACLWCSRTIVCARLCAEYFDLISCVRLPLNSISYNRCFLQHFCLSQHVVECRYLLCNFITLFVDQRCYITWRCVAWNIIRDYEQRDLCLSESRVFCSTYCVRAWRSCMTALLQSRQPQKRSELQCSSVSDSTTSPWCCTVHVTSGLRYSWRIV